MAKRSSSMINLSNIHKSYFLAGKEEKVLKGIDLTISDGEIVALMGSSGSGKSTLMNIIGLLDQPSQGEYFLNEQEIHALKSQHLADLRNQHIGFIFQSFFLLPKLTALQNVCLPLIYRGLARDEMNEMALDVLKRVGLGDLTHHRPNELSGGQQQRVAIARAIVGHPKIILADEPTGALDSATSEEVLDLLIQLNQDEKTTMLIVTHDRHVANHCQKVLELHDGVLA